GALLFSAYFGLKAAPGSPLGDSRAKADAIASKQPNPDKLTLAWDQKLLPAKTNIRRTKNIEDVVPGDFVVARDEKTGALEPKEVLKVYRRVSDHLRVLRVTSADGRSI